MSGLHVSGNLSGGLAEHGEVPKEGVGKVSVGRSESGIEPRSEGDDPLAGLDHFVKE